MLRKSAVILLILFTLFMFSVLGTEATDSIRFIPDMIPPESAQINGNLAEEFFSLFPEDESYNVYLYYDEFGIIKKQVKTKNGFTEYYNTIKNENGEYSIEKEVPKYNIVFKIGENDYFYNNEIKNIDKNIEITPYIDEKASRTMIPLRCLSEALGFEVYWNENKKEITLTSINEIFEKNLKITIGSNKYFLSDNDFFEGDAVPTIINDRTFVPLRIISEIFSCNVLWNEKERTATISQKTNSELFEYEGCFNVKENCLKIGMIFNNKTQTPITLVKPTPTFMTLTVYDLKNNIIFSSNERASVAGFPSDAVFQKIEPGFSESYITTPVLKPGNYKAEVRIRGYVILPNSEKLETDRIYTKKFTIH